jgi:hypothetical protein
LSSGNRFVKQNVAFREWVPAGRLIRVLMVDFSLIIVNVTMLLVVVRNLTMRAHFIIHFIFRAFTDRYIRFGHISLKGIYL